MINFLGCSLSTGSTYDFKILVYKTKNNYWNYSCEPKF